MSTADDFARWADKAGSLNVFGLHRATEDSRHAALAAMEIGNEKAAGRHRDEMDTYRGAARERMVGDVPKTRTMTEHDATIGRFVPVDRVRILAVDGLTSLVESTSSGRWSVVASSNLCSP